mgnify:CR=1 FL=1
MPIRDTPYRRTNMLCRDAVHTRAQVSQLDNEMAGGLAPSAQSVPVQFIVFRAVVGNDTVGVKMA